MPLEPLIDRAGPLNKLGRWLRAAPFAVGGFVSLIGFNVLQTLSLALKPVSRRTFRRVNRWFANTWWGGCVISAERVNGTRLVISGTDVPERENALVIANHQQMPDILAIMAYARRKRRLGDLKFFVKRAIKWVPGVGWGMQFIDCVFVDRDWTADRRKIERTFHRLVTDRVPMWLVSFVEGTRITKEKLARSQEYARANGLDVLHHVLVPRSKGFVASVQGLGSHITAVYDLTIAYVDGVPTLGHFVSGAVRRIHLHVRRFPVEQLEHDLQAWLHERFLEKDRLLDHFYTHGVFPADPLPACVGSD